MPRYDSQVILRNSIGTVILHWWGAARSVHPTSTYGDGPPMGASCRSLPWCHRRAATRCAPAGRGRATSRP